MEKVEATSPIRDEGVYACHKCGRVIEDSEPMWTDEHGWIYCEEHSQGREP